MAEKRLCPKCMSEKIETDYSNPLQYLSGSLPQYKCNNCGYFGTVALICEKLPKKK